MNGADTLARRSTVEHPTGLNFRTPLLVPSFSSKGFRVTKETSEVREALEVTSEWLTDTMLISAYDLHHGHIPRPEELSATPELIVVDSGGYEMRIEHDMSTAVHWPHSPLPWDQERYSRELDLWPDRFPAAFVSYDHPTQRSTVKEQIEAARTLFSDHERQLHTLLLKPETVEQKYLTAAINNVAECASELGDFHFIGVTEKELGRSMLDRMENVARLRFALDRAGVVTPLHIFGALDPLTCLLYFLAGAEVFDGLTWLRYGFYRGVCVYRDNCGVLAHGVDRRDSSMRARILVDNVHYLQSLAVQMEKFLLDRDFGKFEFHSDVLASQYDALRARLEGDG